MFFLPEQKNDKLDRCGIDRARTCLARASKRIEDGCCLSRASPSSVRVTSVAPKAPTSSPMICKSCSMRPDCSKAVMWHNKDSDTRNLCELILLCHGYIHSVNLLHPTPRFASYFSVFHAESCGHTSSPLPSHKAVQATQAIECICSCPSTDALLLLNGSLYILPRGCQTDFSVVICSSRGWHGICAPHKGWLLPGTGHDSHCG